MTKEQAVKEKLFPSSYVLLRGLSVPTDANYVDYDLTNRINLTNTDLEELKDDKEDVESDHEGEKEDSVTKNYSKDVFALDKAMRKSLPDVLKTKLI